MVIKVVHGLDALKRVVVPLNRFLQPLKRPENLFNRSLIDVVVRAELCPLNYKEWRLVPLICEDWIINYIWVSLLLWQGSTFKVILYHFIVSLLYIIILWHISHAEEVFVSFQCLNWFRSFELCWGEAKGL